MSVCLDPFQDEAEPEEIKIAYGAVSVHTWCLGEFYKFSWWVTEQKQKVNGSTMTSARIDVKMLKTVKNASRGAALVGCCKLTVLRDTTVYTTSGKVMHQTRADRRVNCFLQE